MRYLSLARTVTRYWKMANDPRTPKIVKYLVIGGIGLTFVPEDWLPEWMPSLKLTDEAALIPSIIVLSTLLIPNEVRKDPALA